MNAWAEVERATIAKDDAHRLFSPIWEKEVEGISETNMTQEEANRVRAASRKYADAMRPYNEACRAAWKRYHAHK